MSHHFDTPTAQEDPRINLCDFYLFRGRPGTTYFRQLVVGRTDESVQTQRHEHGSSGGRAAPSG